MSIFIAVSAVLALAAIAFYVIVYGSSGIYSVKDQMLIPEIAESPLSATNEPFLCEREHNKRVEAGLWCQQNSELCARRLTDMLHASKVLMADLKIRVVAPENPSPIPDIKGAAIWRVTARRERTAASGPADREPVSFRYSPCQGRLEKQ